MKSITKYGFAGIAAAGLIVAGAGAALADPPPAGGSPATPSVGLTITNPATASVAVSSTSVALNALTNDTEATAAPTIDQSFSQLNGAGEFAGGVTVDVFSNNGDGYTLDATSSDLSGTGSLASQPAYDLNIMATDFHDGTDNPVFLTGHLGAAAATLGDPAYVPILSNSGTSTNNPQLTDWNVGHTFTSSAPAGDDETNIAWWVQPNTLLGTSAGYSATESFYYIPNA